MADVDYNPSFGFPTVPPYGHGGDGMTAGG